MHYEATCKHCHMTSQQVVSCNYKIILGQEVYTVATSLKVVTKCNAAT